MIIFFLAFTTDASSAGYHRWRHSGAIILKTAVGTIFNAEMQRVQRKIGDSPIG
jgi:hypothetical protein